MPDDVHRRALISDAYLEEQRALHRDPRGYGTKGRKWSIYADQIASHYHLPEILDYGCGQGSLRTYLLQPLGWPAWQVREYDPAIEGKDGPPAPADLVVCTDVLEHIEPDRVDAVIRHLAALTRGALFAVISLIPTAKTLSDGRQAHISLHPAEWWVEKLQADFRLAEVISVSPEKQFVGVFLKRESNP